LIPSSNDLPIISVIVFAVSAVPAVLNCSVALVALSSSDWNQLRWASPHDFIMSDTPWNTSPRFSSLAMTDSSPVLSGKVG
jgi:hypothetical protein